MKQILLFIILFSFSHISIAQEKINFPSKDGLTVTADLYYVRPKLPVIVLCHQARFSRGEYSETAKRFNKLGYNCIAIDQRSGNAGNGIQNETAALAKLKGLVVEFTDAEQDMIAAVDYAFNLFGRKIILLGSSYSASLALKIGKENEKVSAIIAFSPGEYFEKLNLKKAINGLKKPVFAACSKEEAPAVTQLLKDIKNATVFVPQTTGTHGSKALWKGSDANQLCWASLISFLGELKDMR